MSEENANKLGDENGFCKQCGHPFDPHVVIAFDRDDLSKGGIIKCPVENCNCCTTLSFDLDEK
jgi:hypothetical protein